MTNDYVIKRTGRRCTAQVLTLESGRKLKLEAFGSHVATLSDADAVRVAALPDTRLVKIPKKTDTAPAQEPVAPVKSKSKAKSKAKGD